jgi:hydrogenase nickel incorporation protein HypB
MCSVCGCGASPETKEWNVGKMVFTRDFQHAHSPFSPARPHTHTDASRVLELEQDILANNQASADANRAWLRARNMFALNMISSPGSGKTSVLTRTIQDLRAQYAIAVIEGDQQTDNDAQRIRAAGAQALQINTGRGCHLDAHSVGHALEQMELAQGSVVFIENVGNLICPALFKLGEHHCVALLSVTEGEDKPLKYPDVFTNADAVLITKIDLLPYLNFNLAQCMEYLGRINPKLDIIQLSAQSGEGMQQWYNWLQQRYEQR